MWRAVHLIPTTTIKVGRINPICHGETVEIVFRNLIATIKVSKVKVQDHKSSTVVKEAWKRCLKASWLDRMKTQRDRMKI